MHSTFRRAHRRRQLMAYALGQILDVHVFNRLRQYDRLRMAPTASTLFGNVSDTLAFFFIAFWRSPDAFMAQDCMEIAPWTTPSRRLLARSLPAHVRRTVLEDAAEKAGR
ncbi:queuosine precursor transporter [Shigella flexneri]